MGKSDIKNSNAIKIFGHHFHEKFKKKSIFDFVLLHEVSSITRFISFSEKNY